MSSTNRNKGWENLDNRTPNSTSELRIWVPGTPKSSPPDRTPKDSSTNGADTPSDRWSVQEEERRRKREQIKKLAN